MNTVNETKTFSSLPEEESALWERMRDTPFVPSDR